MKKTVNNEYSFLDRFIANLPAGLFAYTGLTIHDGRNTVKVLVEDGHKYVVKKFESPNVFNRVVYTFLRGTKAKRGYYNALCLQELGINTPDVAGYVDVRSNGLAKGSYLVTEYTDYLPIGDLIDGCERGNGLLMDAFVRFTAHLHMKGVMHRDYNTTNVRYKRLADGSYDFMLIDIDRMRFGHMGRRACMSSIKGVCSNPGFMVEFARQYAELRGWNTHRVIAEISVYRGLYEKRRRRRSKIKQWVARPAEA